MPQINHEPDNQHQTHTQLDLSNQNRPFYSRIQSYSCSEVQLFLQLKTANPVQQKEVQLHFSGPEVKHTRVVLMWPV